jgi:hypothetical protein
MFRICRDDLLRQMRSILGESRSVGGTTGVVRIAFLDPARGEGQNWRARINPRRRGQYPLGIAGLRADPIARTTKVNPPWICSNSKAAGGRPVCEAVATHMILRTARIYGAQGQNLVKAI